MSSWLNPKFPTLSAVLGLVYSFVDLTSASLLVVEDALRGEK